MIRPSYSVWLLLCRENAATIKIGIFKRNVMKLLTRFRILIYGFLKIEGFTQDSEQDSSKITGFTQIQRDSMRHSGIQKDLLKVL